MKFFIPLFMILNSVNLYAGNAYPRSPDLSITPGALCQTPDSHRYPEQIPYCERAVNSFDKEVIFINYRKLGYSLSGDRGQYKVDHFIPLCAGGSNDSSNLWPQYFTISRLTDPVEPLGCDVLAKGKITQKELVELIKKVKTDPKQAPAAMKYLRSLK